MKPEPYRSNRWKRFELIPGLYLQHDEHMEPKHKKHGWDDRCRACRVSQEYLKSVK